MEEYMENHLNAKLKFLQATKSRNVDGHTTHITYDMSPSKKYAIHLYYGITPDNVKLYGASFVDIEKMVHMPEMTRTFEEYGDLLSFIKTT